MKKQIQDALRKQPKTTKERARIARKVRAAADASGTQQAPEKDFGQEAQKPAVGKGKKE